MDVRLYTPSNDESHERDVLRSIPRRCPNELYELGQEQRVAAVNHRVCRSLIVAILTVRLSSHSPRCGKPLSIGNFFHKRLGQVLMYSHSPFGGEGWRAAHPHPPQQQQQQLLLEMLLLTRKTTTMPPTTPEPVRSV